MKLPETNMETRKMLKELPARLNPAADNITRLVGEGEKASVEASVEKIKTNLEGTGKDVNELVSNVSNLTDKTVAGINKVFGIEADYGKILDTNLKALADNPDNIISDDFTDTSFVKGYAEAIGEKINGVTPVALKNSYFSNVPIDANISTNFKQVVDSSAENLKAVYEGIKSTGVESKSDIPNFKDFKETVLEQYPNMPDELIREGYNGLYGLTDDVGNDIIYYSLKNNLGSEKYAEQGNESFGNESIGRQTMGTDKIRTESNRVQNGKEYRTQRLGIWKKTYARIRGTARNTQVKEITSDNSTIVYEEYSGAKSAHKFFVDFYNRDIGFAKGDIRIKGNDVFKADGVFVNGKIIATLADDTETIVMHEMVHEDLNSDMYKETVSKINACFDENKILKFVLDIHMKYSPIYSDVPNSTNAILSEVYSKTISNLATKEWYQDESGYELFANRDNYEKAKGIAEEYAAYLINNPPQNKIDTITKDTDDYMYEKSENNPYFALKESDAEKALAYMEQNYGEMYNKLIDKYKSIKPGEIPQVEDVKVPKKSGKRQYVSNYARTMAETKAFSEAMQGEFEKMVVDGTLSHERISNKSA